MLSAIEQVDKVVFDLIKQEQARQASSIRMIPSENYVSKAVMQATGSCLTNKYSEGYPGKRYYEGQQITDQIENLARDRAKALFGAEAACVQPHSGYRRTWRPTVPWPSPARRLWAWHCRTAAT